MARVPIKTICDRYHYSERTIRRLIKAKVLSRYGLPGGRKIFVDEDEFERLMQRDREAVKKNRFALEILREFAEAVK